MNEAAAPVRGAARREQEAKWPAMNEAAAPVRGAARREREAKWPAKEAGGSSRALFMRLI